MASSSASAKPGTAAARRRECDLSPPIQSYLNAQGYLVRSEVNGCDITALDGDRLIVIEMKKSFSIDLLLQATERQRIADSVYVALPVEGAKQQAEQRYSKRWRGIERLLKQLELGLLLVYFPDEDAAAKQQQPTVELAFHPISAPRPRRKPRVRHALLREIAGRSGDYNVGGTGGRAILTAYREQAIFIACCLERFGPLSPGALRALGTSAKTQNILFKNVYGWFERQERGVYALSATGRAEITGAYLHVAAVYAAKLDEAKAAE